MLILTRKVGETIKVGDAITVSVLAVKGNQIRLGFEFTESATVVSPG